MDAVVLLSDVRIVVRIMPYIALVSVVTWSLLTLIWGSPRAFCVQLRLECLQLCGRAPPAPPPPPDDVGNAGAQRGQAAPVQQAHSLDDGIRAVARALGHGDGGALATPLLGPSQPPVQRGSAPRQVPRPVDESLVQALNRSQVCLDVFRCPITREVMADPVIAGDGHTYERAAIEHWLTQHMSSPMTNEPLPSRTLLPNFTLRSQLISAGQGAVAVEAAERQERTRRAVAAAEAAARENSQEDFVDVLTLPADDPTRRIVTTF